jgi:short-subunit dehydrogenase
MEVKLSPLRDQVIVITGASSGIGLATARKAAQHGAKLVLVSRSKESLDTLAQELGAEKCVVCDGDVADEAFLSEVSRRAIEKFGRVTTWINNAGVSVYGRLLDVEPNDHKKLFETNFWGVVNGSLAAVPLLKESGGALINIGSVLSDKAIPLQGMYSASKHAVKGFTDALRMELHEARLPISVTLIKPSAIATPFIDHAKSYLGVKPTFSPPVYSPEMVADSILHAATTPTREAFVGGFGKLLSSLQAVAPALADKMIESTMFAGQTSHEPPHPEQKQGLSKGSSTLEERGSYKGHVKEFCPMTSASRHPKLAAALGIGGLLFAKSVIARRSSSPNKSM